MTFVKLTFVKFGALKAFDFQTSLRKLCPMLSE